MKTPQPAWRPLLSFPAIRGGSMHVIDYLTPDVPGELPWHEVPVRIATEETLAGYGYLVTDPDTFELEIVT